MLRLIFRTFPKQKGLLDVQCSQRYYQVFKGTLLKISKARAVTVYDAIRWTFSKTEVKTMAILQTKWLPLCIYTQGLLTRKGRQWFLQEAELPFCNLTDACSTQLQVSSLCAWTKSLGSQLRLQRMAYRCSKVIQEKYGICLLDLWHGKAKPRKM